MNRPSLIVCAALFASLAFSTAARAENAPVAITENDRTYTLDNGIVKAIVAKESGDLVSLKYKDLEMLATFDGADGLPDLNRDPPGENLAGLNRGMTDHQYGFWSHDAMGAALDGGRKSHDQEHHDRSENQRRPTRRGFH